ncbi:MAG: hypothetical protein EP329_04725 [Deltaproteobacteria bacterium]|nr:MAG: hypothetical protein EP329_04725 [Deltaproteobacteria bacterium]
MTRIAKTLVPLVAAVSLTACLEAGRGGESTDTSASDTYTSTDTTVVQDTRESVDTSEVDTSTTCTSDASCDDGDPCTVDFCELDLGVCRNYPAPSGLRAPWECDVDADCDDGDACTFDSCVHVDDGCGYGYAYCTHDEADGCYGCQVTGCDDGNPCTVDVCEDDGSCSFAPAESCAFACNGTNVTPHGDAMYGLIGDAVKLAGTVRPDAYTACLDGSCECTGMPGLFDSNGQSFGLHPYPSSTGDDTAWTCQSNYCTNETPVCAPLQHDAAYWVWGTTEQRYDYMYAGGSEAAVPAMPQDLLAVWDYCLQTNAAGLVGRYAGTLTTQTYWNTTFSLEGEIYVDAAGQLMLTLSEPECPSCGQTAISYFFPQTVPVYAGDGWISFEIETPTMCNAIMPPADATLYSHQSTLSGAYHDKLVGGSGGQGDIAYCAYGEISLSRLP